jgi:hypothetical protein
MNTSDREAMLGRRLERVRRRLADDFPHSPDWAAAMAELEEVEAALACVRDSVRESVGESVRRQPALRVSRTPMSPSPEA